MIFLFIFMKTEEEERKEQREKNKLLRSAYVTAAAAADTWSVGAYAAAHQTHAHILYSDQEKCPKTKTST